VLRGKQRGYQNPLRKDKLIKQGRKLHLALRKRKEKACMREGKDCLKKNRNYKKTPRTKNLASLKQENVLATLEELRKVNTKERSSNGDTPKVGFCGE